MILAQYQETGILSTLVNPTTWPTTAADIRAQVRLGSDTTDDALLTWYIKIATKMVRNYLQRSIMQETLRLSFNSFPKCFIYGTAIGGQPVPIRLRRGPVQSISAIQYKDGNGNTQTLDPSNYVLDANRTPPMIYAAKGTTWPITQCFWNSVTVDFVAGDALPVSVPEEIVFAIQLIAAEFYVNRTVVPLAKLSDWQILEVMLAEHRTVVF